MTAEEYKETIEALSKEFENNKKTIGRQYAISNSPLKVGEVATDHIGSIKIEKIQVDHSAAFGQLPQCVYIGKPLKKDLTPIKGKPERYVWQSNLGKQNS